MAIKILPKNNNPWPQTSSKVIPPKNKITKVLTANHKSPFLPKLKPLIVPQNQLFSLKGYQNLTNQQKTKLKTYNLTKSSMKIHNLHRSERTENLQYNSQSQSDPSQRPKVTREKKASKVMMKIIKLKSTLNQKNLSVQILQNKVLIMTKTMMISRKNQDKSFKLKKLLQKD